MLGRISMMLLVKVLRVSTLLLLLLHLRPAGGHGRRETGGQGLKARQLHQGHQALCGERLVHEEVDSCWSATGHQRQRRDQKEDGSKWWRFTCITGTAGMGGGFRPFMQKFSPFRNWGINKHVSIVNVFRNASNLKEMKFSAFTQVEKHHQHPQIPSKPERSRLRTSPAQKVPLLGVRLWLSVEHLKELLIASEALQMTG